MAAIFEFLMILKYFKININLNSVISSNEIYEINSCKNKRVLVGAYIFYFMIDLLIDWFDYCTWLIHSALTCIILFFNCVLTLFLDSALIVWYQGMPRSHSGRSLSSVLILTHAWSPWAFIDFHINCHISFILLVETYF